MNKLSTVTRVVSRQQSCASVAVDVRLADTVDELRPPVSCVPVPSDWLLVSKATRSLETGCKPE